MPKSQNPPAAPQGVFEAVNAHLQQLREGLTEPLRVREEALAEQLGVSRTPVREALIRLQGGGMVQLRPGRGALLMPVTDAEYLEWVQIREQLEGLATYEAALNATKRDVEELRALFAPFQTASEPADSHAAYAQANVRFHSAIMRLSANGMLARIWESFGHLQTSRQRQTIARLHRREDSLREHLAIIDAIDRRDAEQAGELARAHVRSLARALRQSMACPPPAA
ncbi:GntR family transcriptional regulator [Bordetella trematum]|uniref:GntR family transcriptional regulator n=1 Tax=Bordetella trematum TaxID=123899 RepID=UPI00155927B1